MKKIFLVLVMFITCSLFAEVTQSDIFYDSFENPVLYIAKFDVEYNFSKNLQTGKTDSDVRITSDGKNFESSFRYHIFDADTKTLNEIHNELDYALKYVVPYIESKRMIPPYTKLNTLNMFFTVRNSVYGMGNDNCFIPLDKIKPFAEMFDKIIAAYYEHEKEFESECLPVKPFSK